MLRVIGMVADVTDQKLAEEALRVSEERRRLAQQAARIGTFERDVRTGCITWAEGLEPLYGLSPGSLDGKTPEFIKDLIHPSDRQRVAQLIQQALKTGQPTEGEWRAIWPDDSVHWIVSRWQVLMDDSGEPVRVVGVNLDITERKRAEEAINESEQRFRLVADTAPVMIWMSGLTNVPHTSIALGWTSRVDRKLIFRTFLPRWFIPTTTKNVTRFIVVGSISGNLSGKNAVCEDTTDSIVGCLTLGCRGFTTMAPLPATSAHASTSPNRS
jgi:PAS domain S-box-containing protein